MLKPRDPPLGSSGTDEEPIGHIVSRLIDEGRDYAKAEANLLKAVASDRARALRVPAALLGAALLFVQGAVSILCVAAFLALLPLLGPGLAGLVAFAAALGVAGALAMVAVTRLKAGRR